MRDDIRIILEMREAEGLQWQGNDTEWKEAGFVSGEAARKRLFRWKRRGEKLLGRAPPECNSEGIRAGEKYPYPSEEEIYQRAVQAWENTKATAERRSQQRLVFPYGPVCLAFLADQHLGDSAVDYTRCFGEAETIATIPSCYIVTVGDVVNNFVIHKLQQVRFRAQFSIPEEWVLAKRYLRIIAPKLKVSCLGNHESWNQILTGIDYFKEILAAIAPDAIYDPDEIMLTVQIGDAEYPGRIRHKWLGSSIYNPTHGMERASKFDQSGALWYLGAHTHTSGLVREFNIGGKTGIAALCGSYKREGDFMRSKGFPTPNTATAVFIVFDENGMWGTSNLHAVKAYMEAIYV